ncbi:hypothetical protein [Acinetobacter sp. CWB-B33]|uniref:hypothetical protein n=1 Tax=Acinetobacter sp. CWB-B33 TaxID=2815724 RepID=UPI0031FEDD16
MQTIYKTSTSNLDLQNNFLNNIVETSTKKNHIYITQSSETVSTNHFNLGLLNIEKHTNNLINLEKYSNQKYYASAYALLWLEYILESYDYHNINYIFENIEVEKLDEWAIVSLLRTTSFAKENIPCWNKFLKRCRRSLIANNKNPEKVLIGLF